MESSGVWVVFLAAAFGAEVIGTMAGFGAATVLTPVASLFLDMKAAIAVVACFHLFGNASRLVFFGRHIHWPTWLQFGVPGIICSLIGAQLTAGLPSPVVKVAFGAFLLVYVLLSVLLKERMRLPRRPLTLMLGGVLSGFIAGMLGTGGAIRSACLLIFGLPQAAYIGTSAALALVVDATRLPVYLANRLVSASMIPVIASLTVVAFAGSWAGQRLVRRLSAVAFARFVTAMLALMGLKMLFDGGREWLSRVA
ncbi:MAG: sulfonate transporter [Candidatus Omnitrophica bacterium CG11_big_fil_rev_8_21_14_0_20_63_9]|nr:MAG: sulfonate transporter [Candidatus Omnitrophica bacterium CG11_big_fil_rev_8_21_14_0_20_63_9]